jgi:prepilin-type N-terminal cleavage/methylation domain-containing protein
MKNAPQMHADERRLESGFTLIETMVAMGILAIGLLSLAGVFTLGLRHMQTSSPGLIAREKAREAIESVHTARDTRVITWAQIRNKGQGGIFADGEQDMKRPGVDGLVNTDDDTGVEEVVDPGYDHILGTADDKKTPLSTFKRTIQINNLFDPLGNINPSLRELVVTVSYKVGNTTRSYTLRTYVSSVS